MENIVAIVSFVERNLSFEDCSTRNPQNHILTMLCSSVKRFLTSNGSHNTNFAGFNFTRGCVKPFYPGEADENR